MSIQVSERMVIVEVIIEKYGEIMDEEESVRS